MKSEINKNKFSIRFVFILFVITLCITTLEIGIRFTNLAPKIYQLKTSNSKKAYRLSENRRLGYELTPNYRDNDHPDCHGSFPYINANGFRDIERSIERVKGKKRILLIGDSIVAGHGICDLNNTISRKLEKLLGEKFEVLNLGLGGYSTGGEFELLKAKGLQFKPDMVIVMFFTNDYAPYNEQIDSFYMNRPKWVEFLFLKSSLFRVLSLKFNFYHLRDQVDPYYMINWHRTSIPHGLVEQALGDFKQSSQDNHFNFLVTIWPQFNEKGILLNAHPPGENPNEYLVETLAKKQNIEIHRLSQFIEQDHKSRCANNKANIFCNNWNKLYTIGDTSHPNELGAEVGAQAIFDILNKQHSNFIK